MAEDLIIFEKSVVGKNSFLLLGKKKGKLASMCATSLPKCVSVLC